MVSITVFKTAVRTLLGLEPLHMMLLVFGVSVVLLLSALAIWKHVSKGARL